LLDLSGRALEPVYGFRSLLAFKAKFQPEYRPLYMAYPDTAALPPIATAITRTYLPNLGAAAQSDCSDDYADNAGGSQRLSASDRNTSTATNTAVKAKSIDSEPNRTGRSTLRTGAITGSVTLWVSRRARDDEPAPPAGTATQSSTTRATNTSSNSSSTVATTVPIELIVSSFPCNTSLHPELRRTLSALTQRPAGTWLSRS
jgi:hypothetical protein